MRPENSKTGPLAGRAPGEPAPSSSGVDPRYVEELIVIAEIGRAISSSLEMDTALSALAGLVRPLIHFDRLSISLVDEDGKLLLRFFSGIDLPDRPLGAEMPVIPGLPGWRAIFQRSVKEGAFSGSGKELRSEGMKAARRVAPADNVVQSHIEVPLGTETDGVIGYLGLSSLQESAFSLDDLALLEKVALQVTPAIRNAIAHRRAVEQAEARARSATLEAHMRELERLNHAKSQFLSTVTHELKTPLTSIMAFADILSRNRSENLTERQVEQINIVRRNATHLHGLINDLLDISKTEAGRMALSERRFDVCQLAREVSSGMDAYFTSRKQTVRVELPEGEVAVLGDRDRLEQVITNLLSNAAKYSPAETTVTVTVQGDDHWCSIAVRDQGIGMSDEEQLHLFSPFYRSDNSITRQSEGVGLGLAIVKHIVDIHAGRIEVQSAPGKGSTFTVHLPTRLDLGATG